MAEWVGGLRQGIAQLEEVEEAHKKAEEMKKKAEELKKKEEEAVRKVVGWLK